MRAAISEELWLPEELHLVEQQQYTLTVLARGLADLAEQLDDIHLRIAGIGNPLDRVEVDVESPLAVLAERERERLQHTERSSHRLPRLPALVQVAQRAMAEPREPHLAI